MDIRELINNMCQAQNITYKEYCEKLDMTESEVDAILAKGMDMDTGEFGALCKAMGLSPEIVIRFCEANAAEKLLKFVAEND